MSPRARSSNRDGEAAGRRPRRTTAEESVLRKTGSEGGRTEESRLRIEKHGRGSGIQTRGRAFQTVPVPLLLLGDGACRTSFRAGSAINASGSIDLVMSIEENFDVEIPDEDVEGIKTVGDIVKYIESKVED